MHKTLFLFQENEFEPKWFELEGDYSHLHKVYINDSYDGPSYPQISADEHAAEIAKFERKQDELINLLYEADAYEKLKVTLIDKPTKDWDYFVECGLMS